MYLGQTCPRRHQEDTDDNYERSRNIPFYVGAQLVKLGVELEIVVEERGKRRQMILATHQKSD